MGRSVLVTGGAGYIGSHTSKALAQAGFVPIAYDNLSTGHRSAVKWGPFEHGDIGDVARLEAVIAQYQPGIIIHFAASAYVGESVQDPEKYYRNNVAGSLSLISAARQHGLIPIVFSSSCATYDPFSQSPIGEDAEQRPINPYGRTKLIVEQILRDYGAAYGLRAMCLRYFNAAGADRDGELGEDHDPETHLIPLALNAAGKGAELTVFGDDYATPDGTAIRDYVHVEDLAKVHVAALLRLLDGGESVDVNVGRGAGASVKEIIAAVEAVTGLPVSWRLGPRRVGDAPISVAATGKLKQVLGVDPAGFRDLDCMVRTAWSWHQQRQAAAS